MDPAEFERRLYQLKELFFPEAEIRNLRRRLNAVSLRIQIDSRLFIALYYNMDSGRIDFTTIKDGQRIFGYDNAGGWHYHSLHDPDRHEPCRRLTLKEMFAKTAQVVSQVRR